MADPQEVKLTIRSILSASALQLTVKQLCMDFEQLEGYKIPFRAIGFACIEDYLVSIPDVVQIRGTGPHATLRVVRSENSAHILDLVSKQKPKPRKRPHVPQYNNYNHYIPPRFYPNNQNFGYYSRWNPNPYQFYNRTQFATQNGYSAYNWGPPTNPPCNWKTPTNSYVPSGKPLINIEAKNVNQNKTEIIPVAEPSCPVITENRPDTECNNIVTSTVDEPKNVSLENNNHLECQTVEDLHDQVYEDDEDSTHEQNSNSSHLTDDIDAIKPNVSGPDISDAELENGHDDHNLQGECYISDSDESDDDDFNYKVPGIVQNNLITLMKEHPKGILNVDLFIEYEQRFKEEIPFVSYGYRSFIMMCLDLPYIFQYKRTAQGYALYNAKTPLPDDEEDNLQQCYEEHEAPTEHYALSENLGDNISINDALCSSLSDDIDQNIKNYPKDVVRFGYSIPRQTIDIPIGDYFDMQITEVYDPTKFWFNYIEGDNYLDKLMDDLALCYNDLDIADYLYMPQEFYRANMYCVTTFCGNFHRAIIVKVTPPIPIKIRLFFIDYGTVLNITEPDLYFLHNRFKALPAQAIRGRLANIVPPEIDDVWAVKTSRYFLDMVTSKTLVGQMFSFDKAGKVYNLIVADTTSDNVDLFMNDLLVDENHAVFVNHERTHPEFVLYEALVEDVHLYPTFEELEDGNGPSLEDLYSMNVHSTFNHQDLLPKYFRKITDFVDPVVDEEPPECERFEPHEVSTSTQKPAELIADEDASTSSENSVEINAEASLDITGSSGSTRPKPDIRPLINQTEMLPQVRPPPGFDKQASPTNTSVESVCRVDTTKPSMTNIMTQSHSSVNQPSMSGNYLLPHPPTEDGGMPSPQPLGGNQRPPLVGDCSLVGGLGAQNQTQHELLQRMLLGSMIQTPQYYSSGGSYWSNLMMEAQCQINNWQMQQMLYNQAMLQQSQLNPQATTFQMPQQGNQMLQQGYQLPQQGYQRPQQATQLTQQTNQMIQQGNQLPQQGNQMIQQANQMIQQGYQMSQHENEIPQQQLELQVLENEVSNLKITPPKSVPTIRKLMIDNRELHLICYNKEPHLILLEVQSIFVRRSLSTAEVRRLLVLENEIPLKNLHTPGNGALFKDLTEYELTGYIDKHTLTLIHLRNLEDAVKILTGGNISLPDLSLLYKLYEL